MNAKRFHNCRGSAILIAAVSAAILSILTAGLLAYMGNEYNLNSRSHGWTQSLHMAEAAVELGFAEFNYQYTQGGTGFQSSRGWTSLGGGSYSKSVAKFTDSTGAVIGSISVTVNGVGASNPNIQGVGTRSIGSFGGQSVSRAVKAVLASSATFPAGIISKGTINMNGNNFYSDSFDSSDPSKSTNGQYDSAKRQANGDIATNGTVANSINVGNADIYGKAYTGAGGTVSIGPNGSIGPGFTASDRTDSISTAIDNGWVRSDFAADLPSTTLPSDFSSSSSLGNVKNSTTLTAGDYIVSSIGLSGNNKTLTVSSGTVRLYVTGDVSVTGQGKINLINGAKLEVYAAGSVSIAGNGVVNSNTNPVATQNKWYGLSTSSSWSISGGSDFIGTVYAPDADLSVSGNGNLIGSVITGSLTLSGNGVFHYDESLKTTGGSNSYVLASWQELRNVSGSWVP